MTSPAGRRPLAGAGLLLAVGGSLLAAGLAMAGADSRPGLEVHEVRRILQHGPWPGPEARDPSNRVAGDAGAVALGARLFLEPRLSSDRTLACVSCHLPDRGFADGRGRAVGRTTLDRNTPTLWNVGLHRWFGWDGAADSLWLQSLRPIVHPLELGSDAAHVARLVRDDPWLACQHARAFGPAAGAAPDETLLVDAGKALAAFLATLRSGRTPFDEFRDALAAGDPTAVARYPAAALRGLRIFVGRGQCSLCHFGPAFSNGEFADVGMPYFVEPGRVDAGRHGGIRRLLADRFNLLGPYSDDATGAAATHTRHVTLQHRNFGEFKVPGLRNVALTAPYMHDGRLATLRDVVLHYSTLDEDRLHADGERILRPLGLAPGEVEDLVAFLESLTDPSHAGTARAAATRAAGGSRSCP